jgi:ribonuclease HI
MPRSSETLFPNELPAEPSPSAPLPWVTAHCDGGARGNPGPAGYGAVLQDETGQILAKLSEFLGNRTNNYAEYSGLLGCLQWALDHHHRRLRVVSDSELMVKQIQGKYKVNSPDLRPLWEEARRRIAQLDRFEISHALRHKNKAADQLANDAMDRGTGTNRQPSPTTPRQEPKRPTPPSAPPNPTMLRGFTRDGAIHLLGGANLPDGIFVKIIPE